MKPKTRHEAAATIQLAITNALERTHLYQSCINCENFVEQKELCLLANKRPPVRILVFGCEAWVERDSIPF